MSPGFQHRLPSLLRSCVFFFLFLSTSVGQGPVRPKPTHDHTQLPPEWGALLRGTSCPDRGALASRVRLKIPDLQADSVGGSALGVPLYRRCRRLTLPADHLELFIRLPGNGESVVTMGRDGPGVVYTVPPPTCGSSPPNLFQSFV